MLFSIVFNVICFTVFIENAIDTAYTIHLRVPGIEKTIEFCVNIVAFACIDLVLLLGTISYYDQLRIHEHINDIMVFDFDTQLDSDISEYTPERYIIKYFCRNNEL